MKKKHFQKYHATVPLNKIVKVWSVPCKILLEIIYYSDIIGHSYYSNVCVWNFNKDQNKSPPRVFEPTAPPCLREKPAVFDLWKTWILFQSGFQGNYSFTAWIQAQKTTSEDERQSHFKKVSGKKVKQKPKVGTLVPYPPGRLFGVIKTMLISNI